MNARTLGIGAIVIAIVSIAAVILALVLKGGIETSVATIASLVAFLGVLATGLITAISTLDMGRKLNGHLAKHEQAVVAAQTAAVTAGSVSDQLAQARAILDRIHEDTNSNLEETKREVAELKGQVAVLLAQMKEGRAAPGT